MVVLARGEEEGRERGTKGERGGRGGVGAESEWRAKGGAAVNQCVRWQKGGREALGPGVGGKKGIQDETGGTAAQGTSPLRPSTCSWRPSGLACLAGAGAGGRCGWRL